MKKSTSITQVETKSDGLQQDELTQSHDAALGGIEGLVDIGSQTVSNEHSVPE